MTEMVWYVSIGIIFTSIVICILILMFWGK